MPSWDTYDKTDLYFGYLRLWGGAMLLIRCFPFLDVHIVDGRSDACVTRRISISATLDEFLITNFTILVSWIDDCVSLFSRFRRPSWFVPDRLPECSASFTAWVDIFLLLSRFYGEIMDANLSFRGGVLRNTLQPMTPTSSLHLPPYSLSLPYARIDTFM